MDIKVSKKDAMHILNWLNVFKHQCDDPKIGLHHLVEDIEEVRKNFWEECKQYFPEPKPDPKTKKAAPSYCQHRLPRNETVLKSVC